MKINVLLAFLWLGAGEVVWDLNGRAGLDSREQYGK